MACMGVVRQITGGGVPISAGRERPPVATWGYMISVVPIYF